MTARTRNSSTSTTPGTTASNATPEDSAAERPLARDASGEDSRADGTGTPPGATLATMDERLSAVRRSYTR